MGSHQVVYDQRKNFYFKPTGTHLALLAVGAGLGLLCFVMGHLSGDTSRTWGAFLFNLMYFFSISLGGVAFGHMQDLTGAIWSRPLKKLHEGFGAFVPCVGVMLVLFLIAIRFDLAGAKSFYPWIADPHLLDHFHGKNVWLQRDFMIIRDLFSIAVIVSLVLWQSRDVKKRDALFISGSKEDAERFGEELRIKSRHWSAPILVAHATFFSLLVFDLTMSLAPTWFSTLWGGWSFGIMMHVLLAFLLLMMFSVKNTAIGSLIGRQQFHDIGKLLFGFTVFFAYLTYAHVLTYWYGNIPEFTQYFITRLKQPWLSLVLIAPFVSFFIPFFCLIPKANKWTAKVAVPVCCVVLLAQWLNYLLVVMPEVTTGKELEIPWVELGIFIGMLSVFLLSILLHGRSTPMIGVGDPLLMKSLEEAH